MQRSRSIIAVFFATLVLSATPPAHGEPLTLKIATWNLEWLNESNNTGNVQRTDADYTRLKKYADRLNADVIAIQEVDGEAAAARVFDPVEYFFAIDDSGNTQSVGFALKRSLADRGIIVTLNPDYSALDVGGVRRGADITLSNGSASLRLLSIHLKSACHGDNLATSTKPDCLKLKSQIPILEDWIDDRATDGTPLIVLGDWNRRFESPDTFWPEIDDSVPPNADLSRPTEGLTALCWNSAFPQYIDHIVFDKQSAALMVPASFGEQLYDSSDATHKSKLSDHCPTFVTVALGGDGGVFPPPAVCPCDPATIQDIIDRIERMEEHLGIGPP